MSRRVEEQQQQLMEQNLLNPLQLQNLLRLPSHLPKRPKKKQLQFQLLQFQKKILKQLSKLSSR